MGLLDSLLSQGATPGAPYAPSPLALGLLGNVNSRPKFQTPQDIQRAQLIAQQLQQEGSKYSPIGSWTQGAARVLDTLVGDKQASDASDYASTQRQAASSQFAQLLGGGGAPAAPSPLAQGLMGSAAPAAPPTGGQQSADLSGGDPTFGRMIGAESGGQQFGADGAPLTSPKGAVGIAQVMPGTAPEAAQYAGLPFDQIKYQTDPAYNAALGKAYFDHQMQQFGGDPAMAAAAYNAGPGAVQQAVAKAQQGGGSYLDYLPAETQAYVAKVAPNGGQQQAAPPSSAMAYAPPSGGAQPAPGGAMGAIQSAAGPGAGLSQGVQPQASPSSDGAPDPSAGAVPLAAPTQIAMNGGVPTPNGSNGAPISAPQPRAAAGGINPQALMAVLANPWASPEQQQVAATMLQSIITPKPVVSAGEGYLYDPNRGAFIASPGAGHNSETVELRDGSKVMVDPRNPSKAPVPIGPQGNGSAYRPATSQERQQYNLPPDVKVTVDPKGKPEVISGGAGDDSYSKQLTEGLGKAHAQLANGVEEAQVRARDLNAMQGAIQRIQANGGTTGGLGQQEMLDLKKAVNNGAQALGIKEPFGDLSDPEFLTKFNRQIAAAAASSGANGGRVTNFALQNMLKANPGLELTPQGNQRLIGIQQQIEDRNVAVGQAIRSATADAVAAGQHVQPASVEKLIRDYDGAHHILDPITGQDLTANPSIKDYQNGGPGTPGPQNPGTNAQPQQGGTPAAPKSKADYDALPHGATYIAPDGSTRRKP